MVSRFHSMAQQFNHSPLQWVHGESVTYTFYNATLGTFKVLVYRGPLEPLSEDRTGRVEYGIEVTVSAEHVPDPKCGQESVTLMIKPDDVTPVARTVKARTPIAGGWRLRL